MGPSPSSSGTAAPAVVDPRERIARIRTLLGRALWFWKTTLLVLMLGIAISLVVATRVKRMYRSECKVLFKSGVTERDELPASEKAARLAPKLKEMLMTRGRLERVINEFHLYPAIVDGRGTLDAVEEMRGHVGFRGNDSQTYVISFEGATPEEAQKVTQRLAETMIEEFDKSNTSVVKEQAAFLEGEVSRAEADLEASNKSLATFLSLHPEFARAAQAAQLGAGASTAAPMPGIPTPSSSDPALAALYQRRARVLEEARAANPSAIPDPNAQASAARIEEATRNRDEAARAAAQAQSDLALKKTQFTDQHPDMIAARAQADLAARALQAADTKLQQVRAAANTSFTPPPGSVSPEMKARLDQLDNQIAARQAEIRKSNAGSAASALPIPKGMEYIELETEWQRIIRGVTSAKIKHQDLRDKLEKARLQASAVSIGDHMEVIDPAYKPLHPSKGGRTNVALMGLALTSFFALLYAFARVVFSDWVIDEGDIKALGITTVLGVLPKLPPAPAVPKEGPSGVL